MGSARKYEKYVVEQDPQNDKKLIEQSIKKIQQQLAHDPELQKKAALVIEQMINSKHKK